MSKSRKIDRKTTATAAANANDAKRVSEARAIVDELTAFLARRRPNDDMEIFAFKELAERICEFKWGKDAADGMPSVAPAIFDRRRFAAMPFPQILHGEFVTSDEEAFARLQALIDVQTAIAREVSATMNEIAAPAKIRKRNYNRRLADKRRLIPPGHEFPQNMIIL